MMMRSASILAEKLYLYRLSYFLCVQDMLVTDHGGVIPYARHKLLVLVDKIYLAILTIFIGKKEAIARIQGYSSWEEMDTYENEVFKAKYPDED